LGGGYLQILDGHRDGDQVLARIAMVGRFEELL